MTSRTASVAATGQPVCADEKRRAANRGFAQRAVRLSIRTALERIEEH
jgi:hypothetical protein